jgi:hypothetical protein
LQSRNIRVVVAFLWAAVIGSLMYGIASAFDVPEPELFGVLGGAGAAVYVLFFASNL